MYPLLNVNLLWKRNISNKYCGKPTLDGKIDSLNAFYHVDRITTLEK